MSPDPTPPLAWPLFTKEKRISPAYTQNTSTKAQHKYQLDGSMGSRRVLDGRGNTRRDPGGILIWWLLGGLGTGWTGAAGGAGGHSLGRDLGVGRASRIRESSGAGYR